MVSRSPRMVSQSFVATRRHRPPRSDVFARAELALFAYCRLSNRRDSDAWKFSRETIPTPSGQKSGDLGCAEPLLRSLRLTPPMKLYSAKLRRRFVSNSKRLLTTTAALALAILGARSAGATVPGDLCTGNPCTVNGNKTVDSGSDLDFGAVPLVSAGTATVTVGPGAPQSTMTLRAAAITLQAGAKIIAPAGVVTLISTVGDVTLISAGLTRSSIDVSENA